MITAFLLTLLIASPVNTQEEVLFGESSNYFISAEFSGLVEQEGTIYAASGFGLAVIPSDFSSQEHIPTPHYSRTLVAARKRIYLGEGNHVTEFKVSGKGPEMLATYPVEGKVTALAANKSLLAVGTDSVKVMIFSQKKGLRLMGVIEVPQAVTDLLFYGKFVYAACGRAGVAIIGLGENPSLVNTLDVSGAQALEVAENTLFVATASSEIYGFSLADPSSPSSPQEKIKFPSQSPVISLVYYDNYLYAAQGYQGYSIFNLEGERLEIAEPSREGHVYCILPTSKGVFLALGGQGLVRLEGKTPQELRVVGRLAQNSPSVHTAQSGAFWAVARGEDGVSIVRLEETSASFGHAEPMPSKAAGVLLSGTYLYVADADRGACIFDLKTFPTPERKFNLNQPGTPQRFALSDYLILLAAGDKGARVLWICPCGPLKERSALEGIKALDIATKDSIVYVADPDSGLRLMVLRDHGQKIHHLSIYPGALSPRALLLKGDVLYVADSIGALIALDISTPIQPTQLSFSWIGAQPYGLGITGSTLYVACGEQGILPIDVSDPKTPSIGEFIDTPGKALAVAPSEKYLGVADYTSWILIPRD